MKSIGFLLLISAAAFGQGRQNTFGSFTGFGNVVYPGTGHAPAINNSITNTGFGARLGATVSGYPPYRGGAGGGGRPRGGGAVVYVPYAVGVPAYYGDSGYYGDSSQAPTAMYPQQQGAPQVIINQNFAPQTARPVVREYVPDSDGGIRVYEPSSRVSSAPPAAENPTYLIAFNDHTIYAALAYWVEGETLHYVTNQNTHNQVSLDLVDRDLSDRLNRERNVDFRLPPARK
jgi:hypothetical protein